MFLVFYNIKLIVLDGNSLAKDEEKYLYEESQQSLRNFVQQIGYF